MSLFSSLISPVIQETGSLATDSDDLENFNTLESNMCGTQKS